jgi:maltose alpha-D-glucosyltransferase/alpha-amylase
MTDKAKDPLWYKDAIIYELHIKAFADSNNDGIGDLNGLLTKLDYLQELGVTTIWLLPFYPSPLKDDGYDIADYYSINKSYGQIDDLHRLLKEAHQRGLKVITELVLNHTSDKHPWFQRARNSPRDSDWRNYYVWSDDPSKYSDVRIIFQDFEPSNWSWDPVAKQYFWHRFFSHQPDLNYDHPAVQEEVFKILDYWCEMGVDGFRLDAVPYLFEREGTNGENLPETHAFLKKLRAHIDYKYQGTLLLAEANMWPEDSASYFGNGDECQMNYHFPLMPRMYMSIQMEDRAPVVDILEQTPAIPDSCQWAIFLRNHDELTLEMVTDEERDYMYRAYVKDPKARINLGIRHRLAPLMDNNRKKIELLNTLLFSLPGTPVLYYGDEIGMGDNFYLGDRDGVRTPMQWSPERNAGFSKANPHQLYLPVIQDLDYHYESVNVEIQSRNSSSLLWWMKKVISKRRQFKALSRGDMKFIPCDNGKILAFTRTWEEQTILVVVNLSRYAQPIHLELTDFATHIPVEAFSRNKFPAIIKDQRYFLSLAPYECQWFSLEKVQARSSAYDAAPRFKLQQWLSLLEVQNRQELESALEQYIRGIGWFQQKERNIERVKIIQHSIHITHPQPTVLMLIEVNYTAGFGEFYQLPVSFASGDECNSIQSRHPQAVIAHVSNYETDGILFDAIYGTGFQNLLLESVKGDNTTGIRFHKGETPLPAAENLNARLVEGEHDNTSIAYGQHLFLKFFRKIEYAENSDVEITRLLSQKNFVNVPLFLGTLEWDNKHNLVLGLVESLVANGTNAWDYTVDKLDDFNESILAGPESNGVESQNPRVETALLIDQIRLLGTRTAEMHRNLSESNDAAFVPEKYSLHYQRSLYAGLRTLVNNVMATVKESLPAVNPDLRRDLELFLEWRTELFEVFSNIHKEKIDTLRIRIHGDFHLGHVLFDGKDFFIVDFEGDPSRSFSERRIKRSPLRDVAGMIRSLHYAAHTSMLTDSRAKKDIVRLMPVFEEWHTTVRTAYLDAYITGVEGKGLVPDNDNHLDLLLTIFILEKALMELDSELKIRPDWAIVPLNGIAEVLNKKAILRSLPETSIRLGNNWFAGKPAPKAPVL